MAFRTVRYPSKESGPWDMKHNKVTVTLPADAGIVDLDTTKLVLRTKVQCDFTIDGVQYLNVPYPVGFGYCDGTVVAQSAQCLIKHVDSKSASLGILLPSRPYQNVLTNHLEWYTRGRSGTRADTLFGTCTTKWYNQDVFSNIPGSPFFYCGRPAGAGADPATALNAPALMVTPELEIPMYCLDSRARGMKQMPCQVFGDTTYSIQFEDELTLVTALEGPAEIAVNNLDSDAAGDIGSQGAPLILTGLNPPGLGVNEIPLWAGQYVTVSWVVDGDPAQANAKVDSLVWVDGECQVLLQPAAGGALGIPVGANDAQVTNVVIDWIRPTKVSWEIEDVNLETTSIVLDPKTMSQMLAIPMGPAGLDLPYMDYEVVQLNVPQTAVYNYSLNVGPGCVGVLAMFLADDSLVGIWNNVTEYSYAINGTNTAEGYHIYTGYEGNNFNSQVGRQLHNTRLAQFFRNIGLQLRRYDVPINSNVGLPGRLYPSFACFPQIVPNVPVSQVIGLNLKASGNPIPVSNLFIYTMYKRTEQIRGGKVQIVNG